MKRIRIVAVLAVFSALAATGCVGQTSTADGTDESGLVSSRTHDVVNGDDESAAYSAGPARALELKTHPNDDSQGPHPEPWLDREGPHPEPWQAKANRPEPDSNANSGGSGKP